MICLSINYSIVCYFIVFYCKYCKIKIYLDYICLFCKKRKTIFDINNRRLYERTINNLWYFL